MSLEILAVDDEPAILGMIKAFVEPLGYEVLTIMDSRVAAKLVVTQKFDGVFVDARMPHLDGFDLTQRIRNSPTNGTVPVVMLTGSDDVQTMRQGFKAGVTLFLGKPISKERLTATVNALRGEFLREKRKYQRLTVRVPVFCKWEDNGPHQLQLNCSDVSEGGMALRHAAGLNSGQGVELEFRLPGTSEPLKLHAKVVRVIPPDGIGVQFIDPAPSDCQTIQRYVMGIVKD